MGLFDALNSAGTFIDDKFLGGAERKASRAQMQASNNALASQEDMFGQFMDTQAPYQEAGEFGLNALTSGLKSGAFDPRTQAYGGYDDFRDYEEMDPYKSTEFGGYGDFDYQKSPGYKMIMDESMDAIQSSAAVKGILGSGGTLKKMQDRAGGLASQDYGNQWNRWMAEGDRSRGDYEADRGFGRGIYEDDRNFGRGNYETDRAYDSGNRQFDYSAWMDEQNRRISGSQNEFNQYAGLAGLGQTATGQITSAMPTFSGNIADTMMGYGDAEAQGHLGQADAWRSLFDQGAELWGNKSVPAGG